jgi:hypothetical protein
VAPPQDRQMGYTWQGRTGLELGDKARELGDMERAHTELGAKLTDTHCRTSRHNIYYRRVFGDLSRDAGYLRVPT